MRRTALVLALVMAVSACSSGTVETSAATSMPRTSSTTDTTLPIAVNGLDEQPALAALIEEIYEGRPDAPVSARGSVGAFNDTESMGVVVAGDDVTLAVADPKWRIVGGWWPSLGLEADLGEFPKLITVIGGDARPGSDARSSRGDSIHYIGLDGGGNMSIIGLPRDAWVDPPGREPTKMTNTLAFGGPDLFLATSEKLTGVDFDGYVLTAFQGFTDLIAVLGGLDIDVPLSLADEAAKAYIDAGPQILSPSDALAFARTRKTIRGGDFKRQEHGGLVLIAAAGMVEEMGPESLPALFEASKDFYFTDLSAEDMMLTVAAIIRADIDNTVNVVAPGRVGSSGGGSSGGGSIVRLDDEAFVLFEDFADGKIDG